MINIYTSSWDVCPEVVVVIVDARVFVLEAKKASKKFQSSQLFDDDDGGDVNLYVDYDFGEDDDDLDDN